MRQVRPVILIAGAAAMLLSACGGSGEDDAPSEPPAPPLASTNPDLACKNLVVSFKLQGHTVDDATYVAAGFTAPGQRTAIDQPFCRVQLTSKPSADSDIKSELWMPAIAAWNGRFLAVGGGGNSGSIQYGAMAEGLGKGFATLSTDNGHVGNNQDFAIGHPEKVIDFGHRAQGVTAVAGKAATNAFYESAAKKSYWLGCSQGGGKGMMQSQRYPENFDGIVAGSPVFDWVGSQFSAPWVAVKGMREPERFVPRAKLPALNAAVKSACDGSDGVVDGLLQQPQRCNFDPSVIACATGTDSNSCLTSGQVASVQRYFAPVTRPNGEQIYAAFPHGSEVGSSWLTSTTPGGNWAGFWPNIVYENPAYSIVTSLNVDTDVDYNFAKAKLAAHYDAVNPDLSAFKERGGKIMIWHGYNDASVSAYHTQDYVEAVADRFGRAETSKFLRAFFPPGVGHCGGGEGPGPDELTLLDQMVAWVENGEAPNSIVGTHRTAGAVDRTMPICAYPQVARYRGTGNVNEAANWSCTAATP